MPLGALRPETHFSSVMAVPSALTLLIQPWPSLAAGSPTMFETYQAEEAASQQALSGTEKPGSFTTTVAMSRPARSWPMSGLSGPGQPRSQPAARVARRRDDDGGR